MSRQTRSKSFLVTRNGLESSSRVLKEPGWILDLSRQMVSWTCWGEMFSFFFFTTRVNRCERWRLYCIGFSFFSFFGLFIADGVTYLFTTARLKIYDLLHIM